MKKLSALILIVVVGTMFTTVNQGCTDKPDPPKTTDTTGNNDTTTVGTVKAGFRIGVADEFKLVLDESKSYAQWNPTDSSLYISFEGQDGTRKENEQRGVVSITLKHVYQAGTYNLADNAATMEIGTGTGIKEQSFTSDAKLACTVVIENWPAVGGKMTGKFNGKVKDIQNTFDVKNGFFEVEVRD